MLSVKLDFRRLSEISLYDVYDEIGVYVLWNSSAMTIPSYIGEGNVLSRFTAHLGKEWARRPLDGFIAIVGEGTNLEAKWMAEFGELALLDVCDDIFGKWPTHNRQDGKERGINKLRQRGGAGHKIFKVRVTGLDPLVNPRQSRPTNKQICYDEDHGYQYSHPWRRRPGGLIAR